MRTAILLLAAAAVCACSVRPAPELPPRPTQHRLDRDAEERNKLEREAWFEQMHRTAPGVRWREIERENGRLEQARRNALGRSGQGGLSHWTEVGSSNLAGRMHTASIGPDGQTLYAGSSLGGVWRAGLDGSGWEPLGDNLYGGAHELIVLPGESPGQPDVLIAMTDGGDVHVSRDEGLTWEVPSGIGDLWWIRGAGALQDASRTVLFYAYGPGTGYLPTVFGSTDYARSFAIRWQASSGWDGWLWVPRVGPGAWKEAYVVHDGGLRASGDGGFTFASVATIAAGASRGVLAGSEAGSPTLYAALDIGGQWKLYRSDNGGQHWTLTHDIQDFWQSLVASTADPARVAYGGVELFRSGDSGASFSKLNHWWQYYDDPATLLHADVPGIFVWPDPETPGGELWYVATDGGLYVSDDDLASVQNISLDGLAVSQYYSTLSSERDWDRVSAGAQDQGYQKGVVQHLSTDGPSTPLAQLISGDYGHLTSGDGSHRLVYSTYPGFVLVQDGVESPAMHSVDFPAGSDHAWLPPVVADPVNPETFYFCGDRLYRYDRTSSSSWSWSVHSPQVFGGAGVDGAYLSALAFAHTDPDRAYAATDSGRLFYSTDHGVTWTESTDSAPAQHYFYGNAITVHPDDPLEVAVGGSGYSNAGVVRSTDGGQTWLAEDADLPATLVYALAYAEDGSGDLYAGTQTGAYRWDRSTGLWSNIMGNDAPTTIYWSVESVNDGGTLRFGTYGRGIWDYAIAPDDRDGDGVADAADVCPNFVDPVQANGDFDLRGDACDNCPETINDDQVDADQDDAGNACDCAPFDAGAFATPAVTGLVFPGSDRLAWDSAIPDAGPATGHVVIRGALQDLPLGASSNCTETLVAQPPLTDSDLPPVGTGYWYVLLASNACGEGTLGSWGAGLERVRPTCTP